MKNPYEELQKRTQFSRFKGETKEQAFRREYEALYADPQTRGQTILAKSVPVVTPMDAVISADLGSDMTDADIDAIVEQGLSLYVSGFKTVEQIRDEFRRNAKVLSAFNRALLHDGERTKQDGNEPTTNPRLFASGNVNTSERNRQVEKRNSSYAQLVALGKGSPCKRAASQRAAGVYQGVFGAREFGAPQPAQK
jgi:hypothetical protein